MIDGNIFGVESYGTGAIIALLAIVMVFVVLLVIIFLTDLITKLADKGGTEEVAAPVANVGAGALPLNINDEDAVVACLVASLDLREETKKNVQVVSVGEVK